MPINHMPDYLIISPVKNEGKWIGKTIQSVVSQTVLPVEYILVDDASTDNTVEEIQPYLSQHPWITLIQLPEREPLTTPQAVVRAFNIGYSQRKTLTADAIVKLDGDLQFDPSFFHECFKAFESNPKLGITGGRLLTLHGDKWIPENVPLHHVRGATKVYRWECWEDIGGFVPRHGWDGIDILRAQMRGWESRHLKHLIVRHYRPTGKRQGGFQTRFDRGKTAYYLGSIPVFVLLTGFRRMVDWPFLLGGIGIISGYLSSWFKREQRIDDDELIQFNRKQQLHRMTFGLLGK